VTTSYITPISKTIPPLRQAAKRHYGVHPYFTRRAWNVVQAYIKNFTSLDDVVLDPFGGSGVTAIEALVTGRRVIHVDICPLANFMTEQIASSPIDMNIVADAFSFVAEQCKQAILDSYTITDAEALQLQPPFWYPQEVPLPSNADVNYVHELFTPRNLYALSVLHHYIQQITDSTARNLLLLTFSSTLAKVNRTFISAKGRAESRGGSTIFSIYRYHVPKNPVELNVWEQFEMRFKRIIQAKKETNKEIGDKYTPENFKVYAKSATQLTDVVAPESIDYIYTDPPYGENIAYLDLATMWHAWLGFEVTEEFRNLEVIEGGNLKKSRSEYEELLSISLSEMFQVLKGDRWLSVVFAHKDPALWDTLVKSAQIAGFEYVNTCVQPVAVVWSMHKKKNPLHVLSGELVINFHKIENPRTIIIMRVGSDIVQNIKNCAEVTIVQNHGATTEQIYEVLIPNLLEMGLLGEVKQKISDITPLLKEEFDYSSLDNQWHIKPNTKIGSFVPLHERIRFYVTDYLIKSEKSSKQVTFEDIIFHVMPHLVNGEQPTEETILAVLEQIAHSQDGKHWVLSQTGTQLKFSLMPSSSRLPELQVPLTTMEHNEVIYRLAKMGLAAGLLVHIGKKEQSQRWNKEKFSDLTTTEPPNVHAMSDFTRSKIEQIDCIWFDKLSNPVYAFEVEGSTPITTGIDRFIELLKVAPYLGRDRCLVLVIPEHREKKIDVILRDSHYIGHPFYIDTKLSYLFYADLLSTYQELQGPPITSELITKQIEAVKKFPRPNFV